MKKIAVLAILALVFSLLFAGCKKNVETSEPVNTELEEPAGDGIEQDDLLEPEKQDDEPTSSSESGATTPSSSQGQGSGSGSGTTGAGNSGTSSGGTSSSPPAPSTPNPEPTPDPPAPAPEPPKPTVNISNVTSGVVSQVSGFMIKTDYAADGLGYVDVGISTRHDEAYIIADLVGAFRQEADVFGNTHFDLAYLGEYNGDYNFRMYRG